MCGITGWISTVPERFGRADRAVLSAMQHALAHRGPDGRGAHVDAPRPGREIGAALGFTRLAIRDLTHGGQPMHGGRPSNPSERVVATLNGELYDEARLTNALLAEGCRLRSRCDAELLAHGAACWGEAVWPRLEGMFAAAVWHPGDGSLTLARDSAGQKPLYVGLVDDGRTALWGSELGALLAHPSLKPRLDPRGVDALLWLDYVPAPGSLLRGVYKLPPASVWTIDADREGRLRLRTTTIATLEADLEPALTGRTSMTSRSRKTAPWTVDAAVDALDDCLATAVERRMVSDVPVGIFLSGGVDSSLVAHYAAQHAGRHCDKGAARLPTLSIRFAEKSFDESGFAQEVATHLGTDHRTMDFSPTDAAKSLDELLTAKDEPLADPSLLVTQHLCRQSGLKVALGGDGGDEAWLGYPTFAVHGVAAALSHLPAGVRRAAAQAGRRLPPSEHNIAATEQARRFLDGLAGPNDLRVLTWIGGLPPDQFRTVHAPAHNTGQTDAWDDVVGWGAPVPMVQRLAARLHAEGHTGLNGERALLGRTYLSEGVLQKVDRASMAHGVEVRAPWLDRDVLALSAALPPELLLGPRRLGLRTGKIIPRALASRLLPKRVGIRPKKGFGVPLSAWLRGPLAPRLQHDLRPSAVAQVPGLRPEQVSALVTAHLSGRADHRKTLFALWRLVIWWRNAVTS